MEVYQPGELSQAEGVCWWAEEVSRWEGEQCSTGSEYSPMRVLRKKVSRAKAKEGVGLAGCLARLGLPCIYTDSSMAL